jgi:hypothetical protein
LAGTSLKRHRLKTQRIPQGIALHGNSDAICIDLELVAAGVKVIDDQTGGILSAYKILRLGLHICVPDFLHGDTIVIVSPLIADGIAYDGISHASQEIIDIVDAIERGPRDLVGNFGIVVEVDLREVFVNGKRTRESGREGFRFAWAIHDFEKIATLGVCAQSADRDACA